MHTQSVDYQPSVAEWPEHPRLPRRTGDPAATSAPATPDAGTWGAVASMGMCVALLIAAEFMPVSLLTPIARDLGATVGMAGQAISVSGLFCGVCHSDLHTVRNEWHSVMPTVRADAQERRE